MVPAFSIIKLTPELSSRYAATPSLPHRHTYEEIIIVNTGSPTHVIDFNRQAITPPVVIYVAQGKIHQFLPDNQTEGWAIRYANEFIPESSFHYYSNFAEALYYPLQQQGCLNKFNTLCEMMLDEYSASHPDMNMIKHLLLALLSRLETEAGSKNRLKNETSNVNTQVATFNSFLAILDQHYKRPAGVEFYAHKLNMSVRNLNLICHAVFNKSVSEIIEARKLTEARQLLAGSSMSVSEIGYELGYNEKAYFTRVFTKKTGVTPTKFRQQVQAITA